MKKGFKVVVVGGGPAGSFFAVSFLRMARENNINTALTIIEKKRDLEPREITQFYACREGCNYCAGGISPRLAAEMKNNGLIPPEEILLDRIQSLTIQSHWKNIELRVPENKEMYTVFRGSRPKSRYRKYRNFDAFLLDKAAAAGAEVITGEVFGAEFNTERKPVLFYRTKHKDIHREERIEADFVVFAGGVNQRPGQPLEKQRIVQAIQNLIPDYRPPRVRKSLISELELKKGWEKFLTGEIYFILYGSRDLKIEMSSLLPKRKFITAVLLGKSIDQAEPADNINILKKFLKLPQIRRILPSEMEGEYVCACGPNMTVGAAANPVGDKTAVIGDLAVSKLYKDGIFSAYMMSSSLSDTLIHRGTDRDSLKRGYLRAVKGIRRDNQFGKLVFMLNRFLFSKPVLSRNIYQAVLTERKKKIRSRRRLADILWKIASGDGTYGESLKAMLHPLTVFSIFTGGMLITVRNYVTEKIFGLNWKRIGRFPTGLYKEDFEEKKNEFMTMLPGKSFNGSPEFESMYSILMKRDKRTIFKYLGSFGDEDRTYFKPRFVDVRRIQGEPNQPGSIIRYRTPTRFLNFDLELEKVKKEELLIYRVTKGFAEGGVLVFSLNRVEKNIYNLFIYVAFNFCEDKESPQRLFCRILRIFFPGYIHDVLWNHSLCTLKDIIEKENRAGSSSAVIR